MLVIIWSGWAMRHFDCRDFNKVTVQINHKTYNMAFAETETERANGLQACHKIPQDSGMYFNFPARTTPRFWMKGMAIPIDIVWIRNNEVIGIESNVPPLTNQTDNPVSYSPERPIDAVIEVGANQAQTLGLTVGASVVLISP
jgi:uncharacterized protein